MADENKGTELEKATSWKNVGRKLWTGLTRPFGSIAMPCVFFVGVLLFGGLGIWIPLFTSDWSKITELNMTVTSALATYFLAILATLFADATYDVFEKLVGTKNNEDGKARPSTEVGLWFVIYSSGAILLGLGTVALLLPKERSVLAIYLAIVGTIASLILWWIVNGVSDKYRETSMDKFYDANRTFGDKLTGEGVHDGSNPI